MQCELKAVPKGLLGAAVEARGRGHPRRCCGSSRARSSSALLWKLEGAVILGAAVEARGRGCTAVLQLPGSYGYALTRSVESSSTRRQVKRRWRLRDLHGVESQASFIRSEANVRASARAGSRLV
ncbi:hypothetical protein CYMTET_38543 [Cymbomonas tetramitiformis]|uniref:Uncharacterized protein n=1 Tax=Cymbomonas tetramitiformis TaxID=36881 RepID=A0AAE0CE22_9CHLO|nr:hypothetical protein CYMTET_38543 [Cymbomonas tetramitiformis]